MIKIGFFAVAASILVSFPLELRAQNQAPIFPVPRKGATKEKSETTRLLDAKEMTTAPSSYAKVFAESELKENKMDEPLNQSLTDYFGATPSPPLNYSWHSPSFCHYPLYFEQPNYERYGNKNHRITSPIYSASHFYGNVLLLPLKVLYERPLTCTCTLGNKRPGDCVHLKPVLKAPASTQRTHSVRVHIAGN